MNEREEGGGGVINVTFQLKEVAQDIHIYIYIFTIIE